MSKEQIYEMARDICLEKQNCNDVCNPTDSCTALKYAERAYEQGYRKQNRGIWFHYSTTMMECSICRKHTPIRRYDFCPRCGAKMKGKEN